MPNLINELKLPGVILGVLMVVWQVAQWSYAQESYSSPAETPMKQRVTHARPKPLPLAKIDLEQ
jgi:hypothetical protein